MTHDRFDRLWKGAERAVAAVARGLAPRTELDDVLLETRLGLWHARDRVPSDFEGFRVFACKAARWRCAEATRRISAHECRELPVDVLPGPSPLDAAAIVDLDRALSTLRPRSRRALLMAAAGGTQAEVGREFGVSEERAKQILRAARERVARLLPLAS